MFCGVHWKNVKYMNISKTGTAILSALMMNYGLVPAEGAGRPLTDLLPVQLEALSLFVQCAINSTIGNSIKGKKLTRRGGSIQVLDVLGAVEFTISTGDSASLSNWVAIYKNRESGSPIYEFSFQNNGEGGIYYWTSRNAGAVDEIIGTEFKDLRELRHDELSGSKGFYAKREKSSLLPEVPAGEETKELHKHVIACNTGS